MANPHLHFQTDRLYPFGALDALNAGRRCVLSMTTIRFLCPISCGNAMAQRSTSFARKENRAQ